MRLPSKDVVLAGGLTCPTRVHDRGVWLAHVVKHPLGLQAMARARGRGGWNAEGWDGLQPPVVATDARDDLVRNIVGLSVDGQQCAVPEFRGGREGSDLDRLACFDCPETLAAQCAWLLDAPSRAYAGVIEATLLGFTEGVAIAVPRPTFSARLMKLISRPAAWAGLSVLSVGLDDRTRSRLIARICRADGLRVEFYLNGTALEWRTAWRKPPVHVNEAMSGLLQLAEPPSRPTPLSDLCLVDRLWWEAARS